MTALHIDCLLRRLHRQACGPEAEIDGWSFCKQRPFGGSASALEVPHACGVCGRTMLVGERVRRFRIDERLIEACPLCERRLLDCGFERAA